MHVCIATAVGAQSIREYKCAYAHTQRRVYKPRLRPQAGLYAPHVYIWHSPALWLGRCHVVLAQNQTACPTMLPVDRSAILLLSKSESESESVSERSENSASRSESPPPFAAFAVALTSSHVLRTALLGEEGGRPLSDAHH